MRSSTLARIMRVALILAGLAVLPQFASAQLTALETKVLKIQAGSSTNAVSLSATTVSSSYVLNLPQAQGTNGGFLYMKDAATGQLEFATTTGLTNGSTPVWDATSGTIKWEDPTGASNPNWALQGNNKASGDFTLGFTDAASTANLAIKTAGNTRINVSSSGTVTIDEITNINGATTVVGVTNINATGGANTTIGTSASGTVTVQGATLTTSGALGHTGTSSFTGAVTLAGAASPLIANTGAGDIGNVLVSQGSGVTPLWKSLNDATGIKKIGRITFTGASSATETVTGLAATDIVLLTVEGTTGVIAQVNNVTTNAFTVNTSAAFTGTIVYIALDNTP